MALVKEIRFKYYEEQGQIKCVRSVLTDSGTAESWLAIERKLWGLTAIDMAYEIADRFAEAAREMVNILQNPRPTTDGTKVKQASVKGGN